MPSQQSMPHVHWLCSISMSMLHVYVHVHAVCPFPSCMFMPMLMLHARTNALLHAHAACCMPMPMLPGHRLCSLLNLYSICDRDVNKAPHNMVTSLMVNFTGTPWPSPESGSGAMSRLWLRLATIFSQKLIIHVPMRIIKKIDMNILKINCFIVFLPKKCLRGQNTTHT